jgi:hypothetical protein
MDVGLADDEWRIAPADDRTPSNGFGKRVDPGAILRIRIVLLGQSADILAVGRQGERDIDKAAAPLIGQPIKLGHGCRTNSYSHNIYLSSSMLKIH